MAFWSTERIREVQANAFSIKGKHYHLIDERYYDYDRVKHGKYELTLSRQVIVTPDGSTNLPACGKGPTLTIPPGQYAILYAQEKIAIPSDAIAFISIKFGNTYKGLVNISGFHVDPGFVGHLKFSVYNAGNHPIFLNYGAECFQIWFADLSCQTDDTYRGNHANQNRVTPDDRAQMSDQRHSPAGLSDRIESVERRVGILTAVGVIIVVPLLMGLAVAIFDHWIGEKNDLALKGELIVIGEAVLLICLIAGIFGAIMFMAYQRKRLFVERFFKRLKRRMDQ